MNKLEKGLTIVSFAVGAIAVGFAGYQFGDTGTHTVTVDQTYTGKQIQAFLSHKSGNDLPICPNEDPGPKHADCFGNSAVYGDGGGTPFILHNGVRYMQITDDCAGMPIPNPCDPDSNN